MRHVIDLNADLGEGGLFDQPLLTLVSSANISCGAHAGTEQTIRNAVLHALQHNVAIGAHPSYPDREHTGRRSLLMPATELRDSLMTQLEWLAELVTAAGGQLTHVKPHGALYNDAARDMTLAVLLADCVSDFNASLTLVGLAGSRLLAAGHAAGLSVCAEAFVDRRYQTDASLVPRSDPRALITDTREALSQALCLATGEAITAIDGSRLHISAQTLCIHGDTEHALDFARALRLQLSSQRVSVRRLTGENLT